MKTIPGIAIITYRRPNYLRNTLRKIFDHTKVEFGIVVALDDQEDYESIEVCRKFDVSVVFGENRGVVWNKNRGLYFLYKRGNIDPIIVLEDDTYPISDNWLEKWIEAASRWQHINYSHPGILHPTQPPLAGDGTPENPHIHTVLTGQCTAVTREALDTGGFLDTRFKGYGFGHVEWTRRHCALLPRATVAEYARQHPYTFLSIIGGLRSETAPTFRNDGDIKRNGKILEEAENEGVGFRSPWRSEAEKSELEAEIASARLTTGNKVKPEISACSARNTFRCVIDGIHGSRSGVKIVGWAMTENGNPIENFAVEFDGRKVGKYDLQRTPRDDVVKGISGALPNCGFEITFELSKDIDELSNDVEISLFSIQNDGGDSEFIRSEIIHPMFFLNKDAVSFYNLHKWSGKNLYFGSIFPHEKQFSMGNFIGLALSRKFDNDIVHNAYDPFPISSGSVKKIQSQDVFEHLDYTRIPMILNEVYRVLAPGGVFRLSVPDYRSSVLRSRSAFDENGEVLADLMMGGSVSYDHVNNRRVASFIKTGDAHVWFPTIEKVKMLVGMSDIHSCSKIIYYHYHAEDGEIVCDPFPDDEMPIMRAPPFDMRANGLPISIIVDFIK